VENLNRREFIKTVTIGGAALSLGQVTNIEPMKAMASGKYDIGRCKSVRVKCVSELGYYDKRILWEQIKAGGWPKANQWTVPWDPANAAGSCTLIDIETLDGRHHKFLLDTGWNNDYMDECFKREGVDKMLANGEIEFLFISHEHLDHLWGLETVLKYNPEIEIYIPNTFFKEGLDFIQGAEFSAANTKNSISHRGKLIQLTPGNINKLYSGCAAVLFDLPIDLRIRGEQSLYFNVQNKGFVCVTGCCHQNILNLVDFAKNNLVGSEKMYGVYGGLHMAPFGPLKNWQEQRIKEMAKYSFEKIACNHCTGLPAVQKMIELGYPVVEGTGRFGSKNKLFIGNGDEVLFA
jgi:7,8-dihydropterin-6-yl-methyl-4-(beta-D-ribofuranosyl)aminobenzene 5'-phosphate synthase